MEFFQNQFYIIIAIIIILLLIMIWMSKDGFETSLQYEGNPLKFTEIDSTLPYIRHTKKRLEVPNSYTYVGNLIVDSKNHGEKKIDASTEFADHQMIKAKEKKDTLSNVPSSLTETSKILQRENKKEY